MPVPSANILLVPILIAIFAKEASMLIKLEVPPAQHVLPVITHLTEHLFVSPHPSEDMLPPPRLGNPIPFQRATTLLLLGSQILIKILAQQVTTLSGQLLLVLFALQAPTHPMVLSPTLALWDITPPQVPPNAPSLLLEIM